jgi:hypothetical protein
MLGSEGNIRRRRRSLVTSITPVSYHCLWLHLQVQVQMRRPSLFELMVGFFLRSLDIL